MDVKTYVTRSIESMESHMKEVQKYLTRIHAIIPECNSFSEFSNKAENIMLEAREHSKELYGALLGIAKITFWNEKAKINWDEWVMEHGFRCKKCESTFHPDKWRASTENTGRNFYLMDTGSKKFLDGIYVCPKCGHNQRGHALYRAKLKPEEVAF